MPVVVVGLLAATVLSGVVLNGIDEIIEETGDQTDRLAPKLMLIGGSVAFFGAGYLLFKNRK